RHGDLGRAPGPRDALRRRVLRLRAHAGNGRVRVPGLQVTLQRHVSLSPVRRRMLVAWALARGFGALASRVADLAAHSLPQLAQEGRDFAGAEQLMAKGIEQNPTSGRLAFELGFLYYVRPGGRDLARAGEYFERAARLPGGPPNAARFAAFARQNSGDLVIAL